MPRRFVFVVALVMSILIPSIASASIVAGAENRILGIDLVVPALAWASSSARAEHHEGNDGLRSDAPSCATLAAGEIAGSESFTARSAAGPKFDPIELDAALGRLEQRYGQSVHWMDGESERYLATVGSEAEYMPGLPGEPGTVILPPEPTRAQVIEELMHFEQHEAMGFAELSEQQFVNLEIEAQDRLLDMAAREGWTQAEVDAITEARTYWMGRRR